MVIDLPISKLQHIGIPVKNIFSSIAFYHKLGFENVMDSEFEIPEGKGRCVMMQLKEIIIELYQLPDLLINQDIAIRKDGHIDHFALDVKEIDQVYATVKKAGFELVQDAPLYLPFWKNGCRFFHILGPDGERIEFNEVL
jgi:catechol 2,3-dioxygenase-like lactoylglutathione lyase family enzyme